MDEKIECPECGDSENVHLITTNQKIGAGIGGAIGGVSGYFGRNCAICTGAIIGGSAGSIIPGAGTVAGSAVGGLIGALAGFFTGVAIGGCVGRHIDIHVVGKYRCTNCGTIFNL